MRPTLLAEKTFLCGKNQLPWDFPSAHRDTVKITDPGKSDSFNNACAWGSGGSKHVLRPMTGSANVSLTPQPLSAKGRGRRRNIGAQSADVMMGGGILNYLEGPTQRSGGEPEGGVTPEGGRDATALAMRAEQGPRAGNAGSARSQPRQRTGAPQGPREETQPC